MSASNGSSPDGPTATAQPQGFVFFIPPPPTVWVQFNDGTQVAFTPSAPRYLHSLLSGAPLFGNASADGNERDSFASALNELFQRAQAQHHGPPPTSKVFLDNLSVKTWTLDMQKTEKHTECVICLSDYMEKDGIISLPCGHTFHKECGLTWLVEHNVCPTCRYELPTQMKATHEASLQTIVPVTTTAVVPTTRAIVPSSEREPVQQETTLSLTGVRRSRPAEPMPSRDVRQRLDGPLSSLNEAVLDSLLEEEADQLMKEMENSRKLVCNDQSVEIDDRDVDEFMSESSC
ncbi:hypothetical protein CCR75_000952 [Bremia lactucae]|uniref:RING-type domain-containing protein n=1 Tax=Bremia lactucae TaxID=4779 RepID=A0A976IEB7_BRELC|nr:hypothetical protein CCR75_000952 [Bremia lactucae]